MPDQKTFFASNAELETTSKITEPGAKQVTLMVHVISASPDEIQFSHMDEVFHVSRGSVVSIEETDDLIPNNLGKGKAAKLAISADAELKIRGSILAGEYAATLPFALARPSMEPVPLQTSERVSAWRSQMGYQPPETDLATASDQTYHYTVSPCGAPPRGDDSQADPGW